MFRNLTKKERDAYKRRQARMGANQKAIKKERRQLARSRRKDRRARK